MGEKKVVTMVLKVDLQCHRCYKKVKRILCKFPQIQDQVYDEKNNTVTIKVVCCSPEKIKEKIICKGGCCIKSIEIKVPEKPKPPPTKTPEKLPEKPPVPEPPKPPVPEPPKPPPCSPPRPPVCRPPAPPLCEPKEPEEPKKPPEKPKEKPPEKPPPPPPPVCPPVPCVPVCPPVPCVPVCPPVPCVPLCLPPAYPYFRTCCTECSEGRGGGPCFSGGYGWSAPCYQYDGYYGRPIYDSYGGGRGFYPGESSGACTIM